MRIGEITNSAKCRTDKQNQNLPIFRIKLCFFRLKKKFRKISKFYNFENYRIFIIAKLKKKSNFWKCWVSKISKFSKFYDLYNYRNSKNCKFDGILSYILSDRTVETDVNIRNKFENKKNWVTWLSLFQHSKFRIFEISAVIHLVVLNFDPYPHLVTSNLE